MAVFNPPLPLKSRFITKYQDTVWYCIEECKVEQGHFFWNGKEVELSVRKLTEELSGNEIYILYSDAESRPLQLILLNDGMIIFEKFLQNKRSKYIFGEKGAADIKQYMNTFVEDISGDWAEFDLLMMDCMDIEVHIHWKEKSIHMLSYDEVENEQAIWGNDTALLNELIGFMESVLVQEGIEEKLSFTELI